MTIPGVEALKRAKGGEIWWICGETVKPILDRYPFIDKTIAVNEEKLFHGNPLQRTTELLGVWKTLLRKRFDTVAVLQYDPRYRMISLPTRASRNISLERGDRSSEVIRGRNMTDEFARILLQKDGPIPERTRPIMMPGLSCKPNRTRKVGMVPGGAKNMFRDSPLRRWPVKNYAALARLFAASGFAVTLLGSKSDRWALDAFSDIDFEDNLGTLPLTGSIELIAELDAVITHDTGILHMAALTETPIVALFGPTAPWEFLPNRKNITCIWGGAGIACRPCYNGTSLPADCQSHLCMESLEPQTVLQTTLSLLDATIERIQHKADRAQDGPTALVHIEAKPTATGARMSKSSMKEKETQV
jgi:heptosyltransferase-2